MLWRTCIDLELFGWPLRGLEDAFAAILNKVAEVPLSLLLDPVDAASLHLVAFHLPDKDVTVRLMVRAQSHKQARLEIAGLDILGLVVAARILRELTEQAVHKA
jgi:hypothetical protein